MKYLKKLLLCMVALGAVFGASSSAYATGAEGHGVDKGKSPVKGF